MTNAYTNDLIKPVWITISFCNTTDVYLMIIVKKGMCSKQRGQILSKVFKQFGTSKMINVEELLTIAKPTTRIHGGVFDQQFY